MSTTAPVNVNSMPQGGIRAFIRNNIGATRYEVGVIDDPAFELAGEVKDVDYHNRTTKKVVDGDMVNFTFKLYELRPEILAIINKGLATTTTYDGITVVSGKTETIKAGSWAFGPDGSILLELPNVAWVIAPTSVTGSVDGPALPTTHYLASDFGSNRTKIAFTSATTFTSTAQDITIVYDATPPAGYYEKPKGSGLPTWFIMEAYREGTDANGATMSILQIMSECKPDTPVITFAGDKDDKGAYIEVKVKARVLDKQFVGFETP